eukprot:970250-Lingulodinium_polyedra.AAC.1
MAHGSWSTAHGSWLMARGSWRMAHGSQLIAHSSHLTRQTNTWGIARPNRLSKSQRMEPRTPPNATKSLRPEPSK